MHELFTKVLADRDLSRAGVLFSVADSEIVADLTEVVSRVILFLYIIILIRGTICTQDVLKLSPGRPP